MRQVDLIDEKTAIMMLKAAVDFNAGILAMAAQVVAAASKGDTIKLKAVQRECKTLSDRYTRDLTALLDDLDKKEAGEAAPDA